MKNLVTISTLGLLAIFGATAAHANPITVQSTAVIYGAGTNGVANDGTGTAPGSISVSGVTSFTFSVSGTISLDSGQFVNDADGANSGQGSSSNGGANGISGMTAPGAGYLVGVFLAPGGPSGPTPGSLDFTTGDGTAFTSLSPVLDQVFFIGDGLTGDGGGTTQVFNVPGGATQLYLGISDACGYNGDPSCYSDNSGTFTVTANATGGSVVPEPSSFILFGTGILGAAGAVRRRFQTA
jgi:PEP-CTERM motif